MTETTTIGISSATRDRLKKYGTMSQTYDSVLKEIMDYLDKTEYIYRHTRESITRNGAG